MGGIGHSGDPGALSRPAPCFSWPAVCVLGMYVLHAECETQRVWGPCQGHVTLEGGPRVWAFHCSYPAHLLGLAGGMALNNGSYSPPIAVLVQQLSTPAPWSLGGSYTAFLFLGTRLSLHPIVMVPCQRLLVTVDKERTEIIGSVSGISRFLIDLGPLNGKSPIGLGWEDLLSSALRM